jgi:MATE family multidrug resistance protein
MAPPAAPLPGSRREVASLAWPIWVSMISVTAKGVVDTRMVGELGTDSMAGVGLAMVLAFNALCFGMGVLRSQKSLVSQYLGAGDRTTSYAYGVHAFYAAVAFAGLCVLLGASAGSVFDAFAGGTKLSTAAVAAGTDYFGARLYWSGTMLLALSVGEYLRSTGRTRLPMAADLISQPLNVLFNYALIFGKFGLPEMGVVGAAVGTGLSDLFTLALMLAFARPAGRWRPQSWEPYRLRLDHLWRVLSVGFYGGVQFTIEVGSYTLITWFISYLSTVAMAAHHAAIQVLHFSFMSAVAIADGGSVLVGRYVGALDWEAVKRSYRSMLSLALPVMAGMGLLFLAFGEWIMGQFLHNDDPAVQAEAVRLGAAVLAVAAAWQIGDSFQICYRFALRAAGDHRWVMWVGIGCSWLMSAPLAAAAVFWIRGDLTTVWWMWSAEIYLGALIFGRRWAGGKWMEKRLVRDGAEPPLSPAG